MALSLKLIGTFYISTKNSDAKYVGNKMPRQFESFSVCLGNKSAKKSAKDAAEIFI